MEVGGHLGAPSLSRVRYSSFLPASVDLEQRQTHLTFHLGHIRFLFVPSCYLSPASKVLNLHFDLALMPGDRSGPVRVERYAALFYKLHCFTEVE